MKRKGQDSWRKKRGEGESTKPTKIGIKFYLPHKTGKMRSCPDALFLRIEMFAQLYRDNNFSSSSPSFAFCSFPFLFYLPPSLSPPPSGEVRFSRSSYLLQQQLGDRELTCLGIFG